MRIVSWNCNGANARKFEALRTLEADIAVLGESSAKPLHLDPASWTATGEANGRYLAVAGIQVRCETRPTRPDSGRYTIAVDLPNGWGILAMWSAPKKGGTYAGEVLRSIDAHAEWLATGRVILAGDLNLIPGPPRDRPGRDFHRVRERLSEFEMDSAYHRTTAEAFGEELHPTYYHRRRQIEPFHIDFVFAPRSLQIESVSVGSFNDYVGAGLSDHVPVVVDVNIEGN